MTEQQVRDLLRERITASGKTRTKFAEEEIGCSVWFLYDVLAGKRRPGNKVRECLNIEKIVKCDVSENEMVRRLKKRMAETQKRLERFAVDELGCSRQFLVQVLSGERRPGDKVRKYLGITKSIEYRERR